MNVRLRAIAAWLLALSLCTGAASAVAAGKKAFQPAPPPAGVTGLPPYASAFDATRDPDADLLLARRAAAAAGHNVLVIVGGDWCVWCFLLDRHFSQHEAAAKAWYGAFEVLRVYYGDDNTNQAFLSRYPDFHLFPHFYVIAPDGRLVGSSVADVLIRDAKYDDELLRQFIARWSRAPAAGSAP